MKEAEADRIRLYSPANMAKGGCSFLSLPLELRYHIYIELLVASLDGPLLLWHDRRGREESISMYPQILRVCKQVNAEATSLLYERNKFSFSITSPEVHSCIARKIKTAQALLQDESGKRRKHFRQPGLLSPPCLQRLAHIEIIISVRSVWANTMACDIWSGTGNLFRELLQLLADAEVSEDWFSKRTLIITVHKSISNGHGSVLFPHLLKRSRPHDPVIPLINSNRHTQGEKQMVEEICPLIEAISKKRNVYLYEVLEEHHSSDTDDQKVSRTITREVSMADFQDL